MHNYDTVTEAVDGLKKRGYTLDFSIYEEEECLVCGQASLRLSPAEFTIDEVHRFEGPSDPGDEMVVYAISSAKYNVKGHVAKAFGLYSDDSSAAIVKYLHKNTKYDS